MLGLIWNDSGDIANTAQQKFQSLSSNVQIYETQFATNDFQQTISTMSLFRIKV